ncbi:MAG: FxDxF family PEP-CTERM protein, partial [Gammaproteobacteria bacterium]
LSGLGLYKSDGTLVANGTLGSSGAIDLWTLSAPTLAVGNYYLAVNGSIINGSGTSFAGNVQLQPVPEPETYGMMLAGLGLVGYLARRRKTAK